MNSISFQARRDAFFRKIEGGVAIIPAQPEIIRNHDVHFPFRQDSSFFYLTGFNEPDAIAVFRNVGGKKEYILFVRPRHEEKEIWTGRRCGVDGAVSQFAADKAYSVEEFECHTQEIFKGAESVYFTLRRTHEDLVLRMMESYRQSLGRSGRGMLALKDAHEIIGEMRVRKSNDELDRLRHAGSISSKAHMEAMARCRPGLNEYQIAALIEYAFLEQGAQRLGYNSIVAAGENATVLHYVENCKPLKDGDLLLIDAGAEYDYYTADITRTFPINGKMTPEQKELYEIVLSVQLECLAMAKPGATLSSIHLFAVEQLTEAMIRLKFLTGNKKDLIQSNAYKRFYPHGTGHLLGMDVHDAGLYTINGEPRKLEVGMVFTVEPGFYVRPYDTSVPERYRGIGIRIEDNVAITSTGHEIMTSAALKSVQDMQSIIGSKPWLSF